MRGRRVREEAKSRHHERQGKFWKGRARLDARRGLGRPCDTYVSWASPREKILVETTNTATDVVDSAICTDTVVAAS